MLWRERWRDGVPPATSSRATSERHDESGPSFLMVALRKKVVRQPRRWTLLRTAPEKSGQRERCADRVREAVNEGLDVVIFAPPGEERQRKDVHEDAYIVLGLPNVT